MVSQSSQPLPQGLRAWLITQLLSLHPHPAPPPPAPVEGPQAPLGGESGASSPSCSVAGSPSCYLTSILPSVLERTLGYPFRDRKKQPVSCPGFRGVFCPWVSPRILEDGLCQLSHLTEQKPEAHRGKHLAQGRQELVVGPRPEPRAAALFPFASASSPSAVCFHICATLPPPLTKYIPCHAPLSLAHWPGGTTPWCFRAGWLALGTI